MSKELIGNNGKKVGSKAYLNALNDKFVLGAIVGKYNFDYYSCLLALAKKSSKMIDEVYSDLKNYENYLTFLDKSYGHDTYLIIKGLESLCKLVDVSTNADKCITLLLTISNKKSKSGASITDVTKSAKFIMSNKYYSKRESMQIHKDIIKKGEKKVINGDNKKKAFVDEAKRSSKSGFFDDVLRKIEYLEGNEKIIGISGNILCSKEYNKYVSSVIPFLNDCSSNTDYGKIVKVSLNGIAHQVRKDLDNGIANNNYISEKNVKILNGWLSDLEKSSKEEYNISSKIDKLDWFVGGDAKKILALQQMLNKYFGSKLIEEDGIYNKLTEKTWLLFIDRLIKLSDRNSMILVKDYHVQIVDKVFKLSEHGQIVTDDTNGENWVKGIGFYKSWHFLIGGSIGKVFYHDDEGNFAIMNTYAINGTTDIEMSMGYTKEYSTTANNVSDMVGKSTTYSADASVPIIKIPTKIPLVSITSGVGGGHSISTSDNSITSNFGSASIGAGLLSAGMSTGMSHNIPIIQFNPKEWIKKQLNIK